MDHSAGEPFLQIFKEAPDGMLLADASRVIEVNGATCAMFGYPRAELLGRPVRDMLDPKEHPHLAEARALAHRTGKSITAEWCARRKDGSRFPVQVNFRVLESGQGCAIIRDITAQTELDRLHKEWNAIVAHDMRDPMLAVALHAEHLAKHMPEGSSLLDSVRHIQAAATRAQRMITDLLDLSRLDARQLRLSRTRSICRARSETRSSSSRRARPIASFTFDPSPRCAPCSPTRTGSRRCSTTSCRTPSNTARRATPIDVQVEAAGTHVAVSVENQGPGLSASLRSTLFQRFQRGAQGELQGIEGVGLGLYIARELVEAHDGELFVESTPHGTTAFRFTLPAA